MNGKLNSKYKNIYICKDWPTFVIQLSDKSEAPKMVLDQRRKR